MKKFIYVLLFAFGFANLVNAEQGKFRLGLELGWTPIELEAEQTAQSIANASGSAVTVEYDKGAFVGRVFSNYGISSAMFVEGGYFRTTGAGATYKIGADSASESYDVTGFDISGIFKSSEGFFGKLGMHNSTVNGDANVTIGGTSYTATGSAKGSGPLAGLGYENDGIRYSATRYMDVGGIEDLTFFSVGVLF
jgi:hypothetical protein